MHELGTQLLVVKSIVPSVWYNAPVELAFIRDITSLSTRNRAFSFRGPQIGFSDLEMDRHICQHNGFISEEAFKPGTPLSKFCLVLEQIQEREQIQSSNQKAHGHSLITVRLLCLQPWTEVVIKEIVQGRYKNISWFYRWVSHS